jgi:hypothetical protein
VQRHGGAQPAPVRGHDQRTLAHEGPALVEIVSDPELV